MTIETSHYTNFGVRIQPSEADSQGYLHYRDDFEEMSPELWTPAETWLHDQCRRLYIANGFDDEVFVDDDGECY